MKMDVNPNANKIPNHSTQSLPELQDQVQRLQSQMQLLKKSLEEMERKLSDASGRYVATCHNCQTRFDMLAHHYSIGLFDNLVYVKCPKCHKAVPVKGGSSGEVSVVSD
jgi:Zn finger protein HypA/HybF involved in hydrogenase expression